MKFVPNPLFNLKKICLSPTRYQEWSSALLLPIRDLKDSPEAIQAGKLLKRRLFKKDVYASRQAESYWLKFQFPFWWTNLVTVLDSLMHLNFSSQDEDIQMGLNWLVNNQGAGGLWKAEYGRKGVTDPDYWVTYAICRILKHFLS